MSAPEGHRWRRDKDGLGVCEHRGKVAVAGVGHSPVDRRWDEVSMDKTLGVTPDQVDGEVTFEEMAIGQLIHEWRVVA
jgi:hypothetical protein